MVRALITSSLHNRVVVLRDTAALIALACHSAYYLNVEAYNDPTPPLVEVITQNPGVSPEEMERLIGIPIETTLNGRSGLKFMRSTSIAGPNDIRCQLEYELDEEVAVSGSLILEQTYEDRAMTQVPSRSAMSEDASPTVVSSTTVG